MLPYKYIKRDQDIGANIVIMRRTQKLYHHLFLSKHIQYDEFS